MINNDNRPQHFRLALFWAVLGGLGAAAVLPYVLALTPALAAQITVPLSLLALVQMMQTTIWLLGVSWLGLRLGYAVGLDSPWARALVTRLAWPTAPASHWVISAAVGVVGAVVVVGLDLLLLPLLPAAFDSTPKVALWQGLLASFYGGITEELLLRLGVMSVLMWLFGRAWRYKVPMPPAAGLVWLVIVLVALLFGLGHLPAAAAIGPLTALVVGRILLLNGLLGIAFGYLYWRFGLESMLAHFCADLVIQTAGAILRA